MTALRLLVTQTPRTPLVAPTGPWGAGVGHATDTAPAHLRGLYRLSPRHIGWVCLMCVDCQETDRVSPAAAAACTEAWAAHRCGQPRRVPPGWGVSETPAPCVLCRKDSFVRSDRQRPCHPVCAARWMRSHRAPTGSARPVTA